MKVTVFREKILHRSNALRVPRNQTVTLFPSHSLRFDRHYAYLGIAMRWLDMLTGTIRFFLLQHFATG